MRLPIELVAQPVGPWVEHSACANADPEWFTGFPVASDLRRATTLCASCPVRAECDDYATRSRMRGLWGGILRPANRTDTINLVAKLDDTAFWTRPNSLPHSRWLRQQYDGDAA